MWRWLGVALLFPMVCHAEDGVLECGHRDATATQKAGKYCSLSVTGFTRHDSDLGPGYMPHWGGAAWSDTGEYWTKINADVRVWRLDNVPLVRVTVGASNLLGLGSITACSLSISDAYEGESVVSGEVEAWPSGGRSFYSTGEIPQNLSCKFEGEVAARKALSILGSGDPLYLSYSTDKGEGRVELGMTFNPFMYFTYPHADEGRTLREIRYMTGVDLEVTPLTPPPLE